MRRTARAEIRRGITRQEEGEGTNEEGERATSDETDHHGDQDRMLELADQEVDPRRERHADVVM